ncbi:MAG: 2-oxoacid:acceptor oxidoreductase subunit alpha [Methanoregula sp.]|jgi:2-oxoglutarate ferredoxin oxidoreductase subunit alpha
MDEISVIVGGKAGDGISNAGSVIAQLFNRLGYYVYMYTDYPSLIRGGHNFCHIRAASGPVGAYNPGTDFLLALNQETVNIHEPECPDCTVIANSDLVKDAKGGPAVSVASILKVESAPPITGNSAMIGAFAKAAGIPWDTVEVVFQRHMPKADVNLRVAKRAYDEVSTIRAIPPRKGAPHSLLTGNEAVALGFLKGGITTYIAYPMTPSSTILHFLAAQAGKFGITVVHPENEIAVALMGIGSAVAGSRTAVGTSGGGFCLMTESLSCAGMMEVPLVFAISQRTGPSTGVPTYTGQADLKFVLSAGQGEFPRFVAAPADAGEAYRWSAAAVDLAWRYQVPAFVLVDKTLSEGTYSVGYDTLAPLPAGEPVLWDGTAPYRRYADTPSGISALAYPGMKGAIVKTNSYAHDEDGITTEEAALIDQMAKKRLKKEAALARELEHYPCVNVRGRADSPTALLCWGSVRNACDEAAAGLGFRVIQPVVLSPFPKAAFARACEGVTRLIAVEENATGQLASLARENGFTVSSLVTKYDGRPFTPAELAAKLREVPV